MNGAFPVFCVTWKVKKRLMMSARSCAGMWGNCVTEIATNKRCEAICIVLFEPCDKTYLLSFSPDVSGMVNRRTWYDAVTFLWWITCFICLLFGSWQNFPRLLAMLSHTDCGLRIRVKLVERTRTKRRLFSPGCHPQSAEEDRVLSSLSHYLMSL